MLKLEAKMPYFGLLPDPDKFYEVARIDFTLNRIAVYINSKKTQIADSEIEDGFCEIRVKKESLFDE